MNLRASGAPSLDWKVTRFVQSQSLEVGRPVWAPVSPGRQGEDMLVVYDAN